MQVVAYIAHFVPKARVGLVGVVRGHGQISRKANRIRLKWAMCGQANQDQQQPDSESRQLLKQNGLAQEMFPNDTPYSRWNKCSEPRSWVYYLHHSATGLHGGGVASPFL